MGNRGNGSLGHGVGVGAPVLIVSAPASGCGKTTLTLALLRHFRNAAVAVASFKAGPDFIDPAFHAAASGRACGNLDLWAMRPQTLAAAAAAVAHDAELVIGEGVMGLFDGAVGDRASTADLAARGGWPVLLVVDAAGQAASAAATVSGFANFRADIEIGGVIFNRVGGEGHARLVADATEPLGIPVLGAVPRHEDLTLPERHLGLVQAREHPELDRYLDRAAEIVAAHIDTAAVRGLARSSVRALEADWEAPPTPPLPPLGQRIAIARDAAFAFAYPFVLDGWRAAGATLHPFSPLAGEAPDADADAVYLPGGYPELHAGRLAGNAVFFEGLRRAASQGAVIYGECGGYMTMGTGLVDAEGRRHAMAGLLPLETSFAERHLSIGYRQAEALGDGPLGPAGTRFRGHEFHFARVLREGDAAPLFDCRDAAGAHRRPVGRRVGAAMGSFVHIVDRV